MPIQSFLKLKQNWSGQEWPLLLCYSGRRQLTAADKSRLFSVILLLLCHFLDGCSHFNHHSSVQLSRATLWTQVQMMTIIKEANQLQLFVKFINLFILENSVVCYLPSILCRWTVSFFFTFGPFLVLHHTHLGPASLNVIFSELSQVPGRKVKSQSPLWSHFETPTPNTSCCDLQNGTSPHSAVTFSHLVSHQDEALSQTPCWKEKSWKAFYVNLDQLGLPPKERQPLDVCANSCSDTFVLLLSECKASSGLHVQKWKKCRIPTSCV